MLPEEGMVILTLEGWMWRAARRGDTFEPEPVYGWREEKRRIESDRDLRCRWRGAGRWDGSTDL